MVIPPFKGNPIVKEVPQWNFLDRYFGKPVLKEYYKRVDSEYEGNNALKVLFYDQENKVIEGSNPFAVILVNNIIKESDNNLRVAKPIDLERIIEVSPLDLREHFEDTALILRGTNKYEKNESKIIAKRLYKQIKARHGKPSLPVMIPLSGLNLVKDKDSKYKLNFEINKDTEIIYAPQFRENNFTFSRTNSKGLPVPDFNGKRKVITPIWNDGIQRLFLDDNLQLDTSSDGLLNSDSRDRIIIIKDTENNV